MGIKPSCKQIVGCQCRSDVVAHRTDSINAVHLDNDPEFHGGSGQTLTFRLWSFDDIIRECQAGGFSEAFPVTNLPPLADGVVGARLKGLVIARRPN